MSDTINHLVLDNRSYPYAVRRSRRARYVRINVDNDGAIELVVPWRASFKEAHQFLHTRHSWLQRTLLTTARRSRSLPRYQFIHGEQLPYLGGHLVLNIPVSSSLRAQAGLVGNQLTVTGRDASAVKRAVIAWYRRQAKLYFLAQSQGAAATIGCAVQSVRIGDFRTQWGSCHRTARTLSFCWRLLLAPAPVADYVVAHEVAHLAVANHSAAFWATVGQLQPDFRQHQAWLRAQGHTLTLGAQNKSPLP